ncbi:hypothetical protein NTGM5_170005 [Candidatus Nitrotoga sp. M5]|nr:hypothetical protein NTGM5_170005 [Candidatus Nitrotoga sp. M5]
MLCNYMSVNVTYTHLAVLTNKIGY